MPFTLDTSGTVPTPDRIGGPNNCGLRDWSDLDAFTQGYVEAALSELRGRHIATGTGLIPPAFRDLAPETLARIIADCAAFLDLPFAGATLGATLEHVLSGLDEAPPRRGEQAMTMASAGRDFWLTRNGHGAGFWDGDWPEPYAGALDEAAKAVGEVEVYLGDDGRIHFTGA